MAMPDLDYNLHRQTEAAKSLLSSLRDQNSRPAASRLSAEPSASEP